MAKGQSPTPRAVKHDEHSIWIGTVQAAQTRSRLATTAGPANPTIPIPNPRISAFDPRPKPHTQHPDPQPDRVSLHNVKISYDAAHPSRIRPLPDPKTVRQRQTYQRLNPHPGKRRSNVRTTKPNNQDGGA